jgi:hypothetical protein
MTAERALALVMLVLSGLLLTRLAGPAWRVWRIYAGTRRRRQADAAGTAPLPPPAVGVRLDALVALGFERIGETFVDLPDVGRRFAWQVGAADHEAYATIVPSAVVGALTGIYSAWPDGTWLSTMHPIGETIDDGRLIVQRVPTTVEAAAAAHSARLTTLAAHHGRPRAVSSLSDVLALDAFYRSRYGGRTLARRTARLVAPALLGGALLVAALALLAVTAR